MYEGFVARWLIIEKGVYGKTKKVEGNWIEKAWREMIKQLRQFGLLRRCCGVHDLHGGGG